MSNGEGRGNATSRSQHAEV